MAYFPERYGGLAIPAAVKLANGESIEESIFVEHEFVTKANIDQIYPACF